MTRPSISDDSQAAAHDGPRPVPPVTRRRLLRTALAAGAGLALSGIGRPRPVAAEDQCYWQTHTTTCSGGRLLAYRCEICCAGGNCETVQCGWFDIGPC
ncbi:MAG TPA: hypothetical protein VMM78_12755 [Thermomicrobiales bacterium]|nr:hypothetical protein [Thermomicrobiales bacterium]